MVRQLNRHREEVTVVLMVDADTLLVDYARTLEVYS
jgi:hypothetical protein